MKWSLAIKALMKPLSYEALKISAVHLFKQQWQVASMISSGIYINQSVVKILWKWKASVSA